MKVKELSNQPVAIFLIGVSGSGKSTYRATLPSDYVVLSTDEYFERLAKERNINYEQAFKEGSFAAANAELESNFKNAVASNANIIFDQQNISVKSRAKRLRLLPSNYKKIAIVFNVSEDELMRRLQTRAKETGKDVPLGYVMKMKAGYQEPTKAEGFDEVRHV